MLFLFCAGFAAAFADAVVGGGGVLSIPALLAVGLPPATALGTNKLGSTFTTLVSSLVFHRSGAVQTEIVDRLLPCAMVFSAFGAFLVSRIPGETLKPIILFFLLAVTIYVLRRSDWGVRTVFKRFNKRSFGATAAAISVIGFYDGFLGAGTGFFLIFSMLILGLDFVKSAGNAKLLNLGSNFGALFVFIMMDLVNYKYGFAMSAGMIGGAFLGSGLAVKKGAEYVRLIFGVMAVLLIGQQIWTKI